MANEVRVKGIVSWTYPYFGNKHVMPYGVLLVTDGVAETAKFPKDWTKFPQAWFK